MECSTLPVSPTSQLARARLVANGVRFGSTAGLNVPSVASSTPPGGWTKLSMTELYKVVQGNPAAPRRVDEKGNAGIGSRTFMYRTVRPARNWDAKSDFPGFGDPNVITLQVSGLEFARIH